MERSRRPAPCRRGARAVFSPLRQANQFRPDLDDVKRFLKESRAHLALSLNAKTEAEADRLFNALSNGGKVTMPMSKTFFSPRFGMCADKFGMQWMIIVE